MELYYWKMSHNARKVTSFIIDNQLDVKLTELSMQDCDHKKKDFLELNPMGQIPVLKTKELVLSESNAILYYLARKNNVESVLPWNIEEEAKLVEWFQWQRNLTDNAVVLHVENYFKEIRKIDSDLEKIKSATTKLEELFAILDKHLEKNDFLLGDRKTIADYAIVSDFTHAGNARFPLDGKTHLNEWITNVTNTKGWQETVPFNLRNMGK